MTDYENALNSIEKTIEQEPDIWYIEDRTKGAQIPMYFHKDEFGKEIHEKTLDDYLTKADILLTLKRKEEALKVLEEVREIAENQNTLDYVKKVENKIKNL